MDMKRNLLTLAVAALTVASASAIPAKRITRTVTQPDGTTVTVTLTGDEWFHSFVTSDGLTVGFTPEGHVVYANTDGLTSVLAHDPAARGGDEHTYVATQAARISYDAQRNASPKVLARRAEAASPRLKMSNSKGRIKIEQEDSQVPHKGVAHVPIILVEYTDIKFRDGAAAAQTFEDFFMGEESSARKYFQDASLGQYDPQFHIIGPVTVSKNRSYYGGYDYRGTDEKPGTMVKEAIQLADPDTDFSIFDNDGDGECDVVIVLYAGVGQASSMVAQSVWPCQWDLTSSRDGAVYADGVRCNKFAVFNELNGSNQSQIDGIGTFCHEFSHCLGLPDFYETTYYYGYFGMDGWSLMDHGSYNNDGYTPIGYSAYEKAFMGWIDLIDGEKNTQYNLPVLNNPDDPQTAAVVLTNAKDPDEYFIFETRAKQGWDAYMEDEGMLITHVTYSESAWSSNSVNDYALQRMTPVPADNKLTSATLSGDLWPKSYATEFTNTSVPAAKTNTGSYLSQPVTEITRDPQTGAVSFWVDRQPVPDIPAPTPSEPVVEETGSFVASWSPVEVEGTDVTYTLQVWPASEGLPAPQVWTDFSSSLDGWTLEGNYNLLTSSITLGKADGAGSLTSDEAVTPEDGIVTVVANVKRYGSDSDVVIQLALLDDAGTQVAVEELDVLDNKAPAYFSVAFTGLDNDKSYNVRVSNKGRSKRVTLYSAMAFAGDYSGSDDIDYKNALDKALAANGDKAPRAEEDTTSGERITIAGITDTSYKVTGLASAVYRYRVKAVPVDPEKGKESFWSAVVEVDLATAGVATVGDGAPSAAYVVVNGEVVATPGARLYTVSGTEIPALAPGRFRPSPGAYVLVTPGLRPAKLIL